MTQHETDLECPRCGSPLYLTTESGWSDGPKYTAVLCCADCRIEQRWQEDAVAICHDDDREAALAGVLEEADELLERLGAQEDDE